MLSLNVSDYVVTLPGWKLYMTAVGRVRLWLLRFDREEHVRAKVCNVSVCACMHVCVRACVLTNYLQIV